MQIIEGKRRIAQDYGQERIGGKEVAKGRVEENQEVHEGVTIKAEARRKA